MKRIASFFILFSLLGLSALATDPAVTGNDDGGWWCPVNPSMLDDRGHLRASYFAELPHKLVYFKIDQGFSFARILDQRMSNLHYSGPGVVLGFARHVRTPGRIEEWGFARLGFHTARPAHEGTSVYNPALGVRFMHLRAVGTPSLFYVYLGGQADVFANARIAPDLGNSFLFSDFVGEVKPRVNVTYGPHFFNRQWYFDFHISLGMLGYSVRLPEYGATFQVSDDGGSEIMTHERMVLHPGNFVHLGSGIFLRDALGGVYNPNRFRIGYHWDYYRISGSHGLNLYNASHQIVLEFYFLFN